MLGLAIAFYLGYIRQSLWLPALLALASVGIRAGVTNGFEWQHRVDPATDVASIAVQLFLIGAAMTYAGYGAGYLVRRWRGK